jgi:hypothetical protein
MEKADEFVAQFKGTVCILQSGIHVLSGNLPLQDSFNSTKKITDEDLIKVLAVRVQNN